MKGNEGGRAVKTIVVDRGQTRLAVVDLEGLIGLDHPARVIWKLCSRFDLKRFDQERKTREGEAGRPCWPAELLVSVWVYSYTLGVASARAIQRMMSHEPGLRWLSGDQEINHHTLADFRVGHKEALEDLLTQFLALLEAAEVVDLRTLLHDGTKIRAVAGKGSLHRRQNLQQRVRQARKVIRELDRKAASEGEAMDERRRVAQARAAREALHRAEAALEKLQRLEEKTAPSRRQDLRVSASEPEARKMKHADGAWAPSYNLQVTTEAQSRMIVGVTVSPAANDLHELKPALEKVNQTCGQLPQRMIVDNGYATRANVEEASSRNVELIAPWKDDAAREAGACALNGRTAKFAPSAFRGEAGSRKLTCPAARRW